MLWDLTLATCCITVIVKAIFRVLQNGTTKAKSDKPAITNAVELKIVFVSDQLDCNLISPDNKGSDKVLKIISSFLAAEAIFFKFK